MNIMLVDDTALSNFILRKFLEKEGMAGNIYEYTDPEQAFAELNNIKPDVVFLDLYMPFLDGWSFLRKMQEENLPYQVVVLTTSTDPIEKRVTLEHRNVIFYAEKPVNSDSLKRSLQLISNQNYTQQSVDYSVI